MEACSLYVGAVMGKGYVEPLTWTLDGIFPTTSSRTPILFVLSAGADPTYQLQRFGESMGRTAAVQDPFIFIFFIFFSTSSPFHLLHLLLLVLQSSWGAVDARVGVAARL